MVGGTTERAQIAAVRGASENTLRKAGWTWPARAPSQKEADSLLKCNDSGSPWSCIPATISGIRAKDVQRVFVISVEPRTEPTPMIVLTAKIIVASSPQSFVVRQRFCERLRAHPADHRGTGAPHLAADPLFMARFRSDRGVELDGRLVLDPAADGGAARLEPA